MSRDGGAAAHRSGTRDYRMNRRAENVDATRERIVAATVRLHRTVGPAATTVSAIAAEAGVTRMTVYRHFPDLEQLFGACTAHWVAGLRNRPDPGAWISEPEPSARLRAALAQVYAFYREGQDMLRLVQRDIEALPPAHVDAIRNDQAAMLDAVLDAWPPKQRTPTRAALVGHALGFQTWESLCGRGGLSDEAAVAAMVRLVCE